MDHTEAVDTLACERYLLGEMTETERDAFEAHFFSCDECAEDVRAAATMREAVRQGLGSSRTAGQVSAPVPFARRSHAPWRPSVVLPWAVAATLAVMVGYQARAGRAGSDGSLVTLNPTTLRPATRGQEPVVPFGSAIALAIDVGALGDATSLRYTLETADGVQVAAGAAPAPPSGAPLLVLLSSNSVKPSQHYVLKLQDPRNATLTEEDYRFTVSER